jgi:uncharacterized protein YjbI with pentapeptide repeats
MSQISRGDILDRVASGESLRGVNLVRADLSGLDLTGIDLTEANLRMADMTRADLKDSRLTGCFLSGAMLNRARLVGANLVEASLIGVMLKGADLSRADLSGADLTGASLVEAQLIGAYLVGTYLNETDLTGANLLGAYIRMAQMAGANLSSALLEGADLSHADLSGVRLEGSCMVGANLTGAFLPAASLIGADLRGADLTGADLSGCNLTGAKLRGIKYKGAKLDDAWADWVDLSAGGNPDRASLEEVFASILGRPIVQVLIEGHVSDDVWSVLLAHLCKFQTTRPDFSDVKLKAIHQGTSSSAIYLEAEREMSLAAYLAEFADIIGRGSVELFEKLAAAVSDQGNNASSAGSSGPLDFAPRPPANSLFDLEDMLGRMGAPGSEALQRTPFWTSEKAIVVLTGSRRIWLEAASSESLTLRPPHGATVGIDLIRGRFITDELRRNQK